MSLVEVTLDTGRKHQIRVQMAHHGHPLVGDRKYGSRRGFAAGIALHARRLVIAHPVRGERLEFRGPAAALLGRISGSEVQTPPCGIALGVRPSNR